MTDEEPNSSYRDKEYSVLRELMKAGLTDDIDKNKLAGILEMSMDDLFPILVDFNDRQWICLTFGSVQILPRGITAFHKWNEVPSATARYTITMGHTEHSPDSKNVLVVHGRNEPIRKSMFDFLRSIGLHPLEWSEAVKATGEGSPYVGDVLNTAFNMARAVVVVFTPDDEARLLPQWQSPNDESYEKELTPQARPNVLFEAGMAMGRDAKRTVLVEIGNLRPFSDAHGRHVIRLNNSSKLRQELAKRLETAGCDVNLTGTDWHDTGDFTLSQGTPDNHRIVEKIADIANDQLASDDATGSEVLREELVTATEPSTDCFAYRIGDAFPGVRGLQWFDDPAIAVDRLAILLREPLQFNRKSNYCSDPIWRFRDGESLHIRSFERLTTTKILLFPDEFEIKRIAVYQSSRRYKCFVYVEAVAEPQTGLYNITIDKIAESVGRMGYCSEEYGLFGNIPIQRTEYDDGSAVIDGKVVETSGALLRVRYLSDFNFIITAKESPYNSHKFDEGSGHFLNGILRGTGSPQEFFDYLDSFRRQDNPMSDRDFYE